MKELPRQPQRSTDPVVPAGEDATLPPSGTPRPHQDTPPAPTAAALPETLPASFGRYRLLKLLGKGGMGSVYLAHDTQLDRPVALKVPHFEARDGAHVQARFYREAQAAATILHAHICPLYDVGEINGTPYLTMAYVDGKPLSDFVRSRPLTPRQSALLVRKLALALQEAHKKGVIHRDLKPSNVMIDRRGEPMIMDFGLARRARQGDPRLTQQGATLGTPAYMPPEQINADLDTVGPASDIYSAGVILYELLTGRLPFSGDAMAMLAQVLMDEPPLPSTVRPGLDSELESICLKAMAKKVEQRYGAMADLAAALTDHLRNKPSAPGETSAPTPAPLPAPEAATEDRGIRVSQMGGLRSAAQLAAQLPAPKAADKPRRRHRRKKAGRARVAPWEWLVGASAVGILLLLGWLALRGPAPSGSEHAPEGKDGAGRPEEEERRGPVGGKGQGFPSLFNGKDLTGWEVESGDRTRWFVEAGELVAAGAERAEDMGWLLTRKGYADFVLRLDFLLSPGGNSGVALRAATGEKQHLEIQILDDPNFPAVAPTARAGSLNTLALDRRAALNAPGKWNRLEIEVRGRSLRVTVNGQDTLRTNLDRFAAHADRFPALRRAWGQIGLQNWKRPVRFRNIQLQNLSARD